ncbi:hypothetical protein [Amaricoccus sp.]|uniref:hypothetical protein n=1 Tax=Amaricoccus sp. TaxID=1872485 RepID=UPI0025BB7557|nr:hypothetical protein [Amaricoccus sp.]
MSELGFLQAFGWWGSFLLALIALSLRLFWGINKDEGRGRWIAWLRHDTFARRYREMLNAGLDRVDRLLSPDFPRLPTDRRNNPKTELSRAWSAPLPRARPRRLHGSAFRGSLRRYGNVLLGLR